MATAQNIEKRIEGDVNAALNELQSLADEIRVKVHLAGMDAKDAWNKLEPRLDEAKRHAKKASNASLEAVNDVKKAFKSFAKTL